MCCRVPLSPDESTVCGVCIFPECTLTDPTHLPKWLPIRNNKMTRSMPTTKPKRGPTIPSHELLLGVKTIAKKYINMH